MQGHEEPCYYCGELTNDLAGNPSLWSLPLTHSDDPGVVKWHHVKCVHEQLLENNQEILEAAQRENLRWIPISLKNPDKQASYPVLHSKRGQVFALWNNDNKQWEMIDYPHYITHWYDLPAEPKKVYGKRKKA